MTLESITRDLARQLTSGWYSDLDADVVHERLHEAVSRLAAGRITRATALAHYADGIVPGFNSDPGFIYNFDQAITLALYRHNKEQGND